MIKFDLTTEGVHRVYTAKTMDGEILGHCRFGREDYVLVIDELTATEADVAEGLCRAAFDMGLRELCAYGSFRNISCPALEETCFKGLSNKENFLTTQFFHTCSSCFKN